MSMTESFQEAVGRGPASRGVIISDFDGTINGMKDGRRWNDDLFICMIGWKKSGYDVFFNTTSASSSVDGTIQMRSIGAKVDRNFFAVNEEFPEDGIALQKLKTMDWDVVANFDDEEMPRSGKTGIRLDPNDPHVAATLKRIATDYEASGRTQILTFNPHDFTTPGAGFTPPQPVSPRV